MVARVRLDDLPPELRRQIADAARRGETRTRVEPGPPAHQPPRARPVRLPPGAQVRCEACGEVFDCYGSEVERHVDEQHHGARVAIVLETGEPS